MTPLSQLADRIDALAKPDKIKFGIWPTGGWVISSSRETVKLLCDIWNARGEIAVALRASHLPAVNVEGMVS